MRRLSHEISTPRRCARFDAYEAKEKSNAEDELTAAILEIFQKSRKNYGTRKIKHELEKLGMIASRRRIGRIMKENGLVSNYTIAKQYDEKSEKVL